MPGESWPVWRLTNAVNLATPGCPGVPWVNTNTPGAREFGTANNWLALCPAEHSTNIIVVQHINFFLFSQEIFTCFSQCLIIKLLHKVQRVFVCRAAAR